MIRNKLLDISIRIIKKNSIKTISACQHAIDSYIRKIEIGIIDKTVKWCLLLFIYIILHNIEWFRKSNIYRFHSVGVCIINLSRNEKQIFTAVCFLLIHILKMKIAQQKNKTAIYVKFDKYFSLIPAWLQLLLTIQRNNHHYIQLQLECMILSNKYNRKLEKKPRKCIILQSNKMKISFCKLKTEYDRNISIISFVLFICFLLVWKCILI